VELFGLLLVLIVIFSLYMLSLYKEDDIKREKSRRIAAEDKSQRDLPSSNNAIVEQLNNLQPQSSNKDVAVTPPSKVFSPKILRPEYADFLDERGVKYLVHFTGADNLASIFKHGIVPRFEHKILGLNSIYNDSQRLDGHLDATSFTFSFPNYKFLFSLRNKFPERDFAALFVDAKVVCELRAAFYSTNAASFSVTRSLSHESIDALKLMFEDPHCGMPSRHELSIPNFCTTDPQAEVLVYGTIPAKYIKVVCFSNEHTLKRYISSISSEVSAISDYRVFGPRRDAKFWQTHKFKKEPKYDWFGDLQTYTVPDTKSPTDVFAPIASRKKLDEKFIAEMNAKADSNIAALNSPIEKSCYSCMEYISERCFGGRVCSDYRFSGRELRH